MSRPWHISCSYPKNDKRPLEFPIHNRDSWQRFRDEFLRLDDDWPSGWEDICFNNGPLLSPATFRQLILPHMKPVLQLLRQHGIDIIFTDGHIGALIPLYMEVGLNCPDGVGWMTTGDYQQIYNLAGGVGTFCLLPGVWNRIDMPDKEHCYDAEIQGEALAFFKRHL